MGRLWQNVRSWTRGLWTSVADNERARRGRLGEDLALRYLKGKGFALVRRNARIGGGEIDLVMRDGEALVFVEVRARRAGALVSGYHSITKHKRKVFKRAAAAYLHALEHPCKTHRYDVVQVELADAGDSHVCQHFENVSL